MAAATRFADYASRLRVRRMDALTARSAMEDSEGRFSDALLSRVDLFTGKLEPLADAWDEAAAILREHARHMDELAIATRTARRQAEDAEATLLSARRLAIDSSPSGDHGLSAPSPIVFDGDPTYLYRWQTAQADLAGARARLSNLAQSREDLDRMTARRLEGIGLVNELTPTAGASAGIGVAQWLGDYAAVTAADLGSLTDPAQVAAVWAKLSTEQQAALIASGALILGSLAGLPPAVRVAANKLNAERRIPGLEARIAEIEALNARGGHYSGPTAHADELKRLREELRYLRDVQDGTVQLYLYEPDQQSIIEMIGTPGPETKTMVTYVPGTFTSVYSFYAGQEGVTQVTSWLNARDDSIVGFVWKRGTFPGEDPTTGGMNLGRVLEANDEAATLAKGADLAAFQREIFAASPVLGETQQVPVGHSWGLAAITASEVEGAHYDQVISLSGAGMPEDWSPENGTRYSHYAYTDILTMAQSSGAVWDGRIPATDPAFQQHHYSREGDFTFYFPTATTPGGAVVSPSPPPSMDASWNAFDNHNLIASSNPDNQALVDILRSIESGVTR